MMEYKNLLVMVDPAKDEQISLQRAIFLASNYGAKITVLLAVYDLSYEMTSMLSQEERELMRTIVIEQYQEWLNSEIKQYDDIQIDTHVIWHNRPYQAAIDLIQTKNHDLLIKATHHHDKLQSIIFTPTDWNLLRKSPCDVLLVKDHEWPVNGKILTAINSIADDESHINLNHKVLQHACDMASIIDAKVKVINACPSSPANITIEIPDFNAVQYNQSVREHHLERTIELAEQFNIPSEHCFVEPGLAEDVIPKITTEIDAELVIIGTIGRTGISAAFIGNTAEHIIDSINCDLLAVKPDGFKLTAQS